MAEQSALVSHWYLDKTLGSDSNEGTSITTPLKTGAELARRLGPNPIWPQSVTVEVLQNGLDDPLTVQGTLENTLDWVDVIGTPTTLATGTVGAYTKRNHTTREGNILTVSGIEDLTPYLYKRIRVTSGAYAGGVLWIVKINPTGGGLNTARVSQMAVLSTTDPNNLLEPSKNFAVGDAIVIEDLPYVPAIRTQVSGPPTSGAEGSTAYDRRHLVVSNFDTRDWTDDSSGRDVTFRVCFVGGKLQSYSDRRGANNAYANIFGSFIYQQGQVIFAGSHISGLILSSAIVGSPLNNSSFIGAMSGTGLMYVTIQGVGLMSPKGSLYVVDTQIFDWLNVHPKQACILGDFAQIASNLSGYSNEPETYGLGLYNGVTIQGISNINLQGTAGQVRLFSTPQVALTNAQLAKGVDFSQKGEATLSAGTAVVTVPWYDHLSQKVMAVHTTFGGTPGILRVTQTSSTQFTITSSNAEDTSTVNWQISPLGRGITLVNY